MGAGFLSSTRHHSLDGLCTERESEGRAGLGALKRVGGVRPGQTHIRRAWLATVRDRTERSCRSSGKMWDLLNELL